MAVIKQIKVGSTTYDIDAPYWQGHQWSELKNVKFIVCWTKTQWQSTQAPSDSEKGQIPADIYVQYASGASSAIGALAASDADTSAFYLIYSPNRVDTGEVDNFDEYVVVGTGTNATWEKIGGTGAIDLSNYVQKGNYTTNEAGATQTGPAGEQNAVGTATVTYYRADGTDGAGGHSHTVYAATATFKNATSATLDAGKSEHSHTVNIGTNAITYVSSVGDTESKGGHTHGVNVSTATTSVVHSVGTMSEQANHTHTVNIGTATIAYVKSVDAETNNTGGHSHDVVATGSTINVVASATISEQPVHSHTISIHQHGNLSVRYFNAKTAGNVEPQQIMCAPSVTSAGVLLWDVASTTANDLQTANGTTIVSVSSNGAHSHTLNSNSKAVLTGMNISTEINGDHKHQITATSDTITYVTGATVTGAGKHSHTFTGGSASQITYVTGATLDSAGAHTHSVASTTLSAAFAISATLTAAGSHTHGVTLSGATVTYVTGATTSYQENHSHGITDSLAYASGTASVAVGNHTHSIAQHTHRVTL